MQVLAPTFKLFECFDDSFCHPAMSFLRATQNGKLLARSDTLVTVLIIKADAKETGFLGWVVGLWAHAIKVLELSAVSSGISSVL